MKKTTSSKRRCSKKPSRAKKTQHFSQSNIFGFPWSLLINNTVKSAPSINDPYEIYSAAIEIPAGTYTIQELENKYLNNITVFQGEEIGLKGYELQIYVDTEYPYNEQMLLDEISHMEDVTGITINPNDRVEVSHPDKSTTQIKGKNGMITLTQKEGSIQLFYGTPYYIYQTDAT